MSDNLPAIPEHGDFESVITFSYEGKAYTIKNNKLYRANGDVAVVYSPGFGGGWSTWCSVSATDARVALTVLVNGTATIGITEYDEPRDLVVDKGIGFIYSEWYERGSHGDTLKITWLAPGTAYQITEYDGSETVETRDSMGWSWA